MPQETTIIDDSSPKILYSGQWTSGGTSQEYNHTVHGSWTKGSQASISFTGTSIAVYGTIGRENNNGDPAFAPITTYTIDGESNSNFTGTPGTEILYNQLFYQSPKLSDGQHQLIVTLDNSNMNTAWIDYLEVEKTPFISPGVIAGAVVGAVVGVLLLAIIGVLLRRISRLQRRKVQYEQVPRKPSALYWPWMSRTPEVVPFGSDQFAETQPLTIPRPFSLNSSNYPPSSEHSDIYTTRGSISAGTNRDSSSTGLTSLTGYTTQGGTSADKSASRANRESSSTHTSLSGYTTQGSTSADKTASRLSRDSNATGHTSLSGFTTRGGTFADKTITSPISASTTGSTSASEPTGYTVRSGTSAGKANRRSRPPATASIHSSPTNDSLDLRPRPFQLPAPTPTTNRVVVEGEDAPPAYAVPRPILV